MKTLINLLLIQANLIVAGFILSRVWRAVRPVHLAIGLGRTLLRFRKDRCPTCGVDVGHNHRGDCGDDVVWRGSDIWSPSIDIAAALGTPLPGPNEPNRRIR